MSYRIETITDFSDFLKLEPLWDEVANQQAEYTPFLSHAWFKIWLEHFLNQNRLLILLVYKRNRLELICPLMWKKGHFKGTATIRRARPFKGIPVRGIEFLGNTYSPLNKFIFNSRTDRELLLTCWLAYFTKHHRKWDLINLPSIPKEDGTSEILRGVLRKANLNAHEYFCFGNWYLKEINYSGSDYLQSRGSNIKNNVKRYSRKLKRMGSLAFEMITDTSDIDHYMDLYRKVYESSWKEPEPDPDFYHHFARLAGKKSWLRLGFLLFDGSPIASQLWLVCKDVAYIVRLVYDEAYKKFIPGIILTSEMMKYVIDLDGVRQVDYLMGDEPYKKDWTPLRRERRGILIFNNNFKGTILSWLEQRFVPFMKQLPSWNRILKHI